MSTPGPAIRRYAAFSTTSLGGNPAGVVLQAQDLTDAQMQGIAAEVGYSETAFLTGPITVHDPIRIRYFAPAGEVDFCGHATLATAVALGEEKGLGDYLLQTNVGQVAVSALKDAQGLAGTLESPPIGCSPLAEDELEALLHSLRWTKNVLHPGYAPAIGLGGNHHPVLVLNDVETLSTLDYDFDELQALSRRKSWITVQLVVPTGPGQWRARNPFPWGGVREDPATGAAAAAFAGYLRAGGHLLPGGKFTIEQGVEMGRPSSLEVTMLADSARIGGYATVIE